ncbi:MAG: DUF3322 domain-containing protein [Opitutaceae bacterium]|nr:DUF3322 domain-containing protein [Opitutaceae bacterium]
MLTPADITAFAQRRYRDFLRAVATDEVFFPLRVPLGEWPTDDFAVLKDGAKALRGIEKARRGSGLRIEWTPCNTRRFGEQLIPTGVTFETEEDFVRFLGRTEEVAKFRVNLAETRAQIPALAGWVARHPHRVVEKCAIWQDLLLVCAYFQYHPRPGCYPREIRLPIDTKFIETQQPTLRQLLDEILPADARTEDEEFHLRFGLRIDETPVRVRWLGLPPSDAAVLLADFTSPLSVLAAANLTPTGIVVVENKTTFLTLPRNRPGWLALLGNGNSVVVCGALPWLRGRPLLYWGDIDPAGFQILARLRTLWPQTCSILMDAATLHAHETWWSKPGLVPDAFPETLTPEERSLYEQVRDHGIRLEQERILQTWVDAAVQDRNTMEARGP